MAISPYLRQPPSMQHPNVANPILACCFPLAPIQFSVKSPRQRLGEQGSAILRCNFSLTCQGQPYYCTTEGTIDLFTEASQGLCNRNTKALHSTLTLVLLPLLYIHELQSYPIGTSPLHPQRTTVRFCKPLALTVFRSRNLTECGKNLPTSALFNQQPKAK